MRQPLDQVIVSPAGVAHELVDPRSVEVHLPLRQRAHLGRHGSRRGLVGAGQRQQLGVHPPGRDHDASLHLSFGEADDTAQDRGPHMQLDLLGDPQARVHEVAEAVAAAGPGLDFERDRAVVGGDAELDLAGLEMTRQGGEPERGGVDGHHPDGSVPGAGHADDVLVAHPHPSLLSPQLLEGRELRRRGGVGIRGHPRHQLFGGDRGADDSGAIDPVDQRAAAVRGQLQILLTRLRGESGRRVVGPGPGQLPAMNRGRAPHITSHGQPDPHRPACGGCPSSPQ